MGRLWDLVVPPAGVVAVERAGRGELGVLELRISLQTGDEVVEVGR